MSKPFKIGFDGNPPCYVEARGSEVRDPKTGKIVREAIIGPQNINIDRLEWLLAHKRIEMHHHAAGRRLQREWETSQLMGYVSLEGGGGGSGTNRLSDVKCDAMAKVNAAKLHVGDKAWRILELVVLENMSPEKAGAKMRMMYRHSMGALTVALDTLARHYGLA